MDQAAQRKWDEWARDHQDLLGSVERGPDAEQTRRVAADLAEKLELGPEDRLLDVGCGSGLLLSLLQVASGADVFGVDFAPSQLALGRHHFPDIPFAAACAEAVPFADGSFTKVLCYGVWHYVESWQETLDRLVALVRPPGIVLIGDLPSRHHRHRLYLQYFKKLPSLLVRPGLFMRKLHYSQETSHWHWIDLKETRAYVESRGHRAEVLPQPKGHRQYGSVTHVYRFDLKVRVE